MAGFKDISLSFAKYTENETVGLTLTDGAAAAFKTGAVVTLGNVNYAAKSADSIDEYTDATSTDKKTIVGKLVPNKQFIVAEDIKSGDKYVVVYRIKDDDALSVDAATANA